MLLPCSCRVFHALALLLPCSRRARAMLLPCYFHASVLLPWFCHVLAILLLWFGLATLHGFAMHLLSCHALAMPLPCPCHALTIAMIAESRSTRIPVRPKHSWHQWRRRPPQPQLVLRRPAKQPSPTYASQHGIWAYPRRSPFAGTTPSPSSWAPRPTTSTTYSPWSTSPR